MYEFFKNIAAKNSCLSQGACSIHPSVNALYEILLLEIREISFYLVKLKEFGITNKIAMAESIEALSIFLINTSFNKEKYLNLIQRLHFLKIKTKEKYLDYCAEREFPCEIINTNLNINEKTTISQLIKYYESRQKNPDSTKQRLFELITIAAKLCAINVVKIKKLDSEFDSYDFEILRFFALTNSYSIRNEKIKRRIKEFSTILFETKVKLSKVYEEKYGKKTHATINTTPQKGHSILVSGDDIDELDNLLTTLGELNPSEPINVYTHGAMILAHFYPRFQNNKFLKGHFGSDDAQYDFSIFPGAILITQNFIQKIDTLYKGEIFSNKIISFEKMLNIKNNDYKPVIEAALGLDGFLEVQAPQPSINITYDIDETNNALNNLNQDKVVIIAGSMDENETQNYEQTKIINLNFPLEADLLLETSKFLKEKGIKTTLFFTLCSLEGLGCVISLLQDENIDIYLANCSYVLINPHVLEALKLDFNIKII